MTASMAESIFNISRGVALLGVSFLDFFVAVGLAALFRKDHIKWWHAFIPGVQEYDTAIIAEREEDGRTYFLLSVCRILAVVIAVLFAEGSRMNRFWMLVSQILYLALVLFSIRIFLGLCRVFERRKGWTILWVAFPVIPALIWGFGKKFRPNHKAPDMDYEKAAAISGATVDAIQHGLTVNLTDRTAMDFLRKKVLLKDIHMSIPTGHMVLLLGGSGAGKTTFLNAVTGYEKANAEIILNGRDLYNNYESMKYDLGFVPQQDLMRFNDTVYKTVADAAALRLPKNMRHSEKKKRIAEVLEKFGLHSIMNSQVGKLSGGQRKRLSIAMELISDPTLFILDEPDSGLDGVVARNLFESLRRIADEGKIVIVITHTPDRVIDLFDDVIVLAKDAARTGRLAYYGSVKEASAFFGKESMEQILLSINQKDEGGEGRADEFVEKYSAILGQKAV